MSKITYDVSTRSSAVTVGVKGLDEYMYCSSSVLIGCSFSPSTNEIACYNVVSSGLRNRLPSGNVLSAELAVPSRPGLTAARSKCAINLLGKQLSSVQFSMTNINLS